LIFDAFRNGKRNEINVGDQAAATAATNKSAILNAGVVVVDVVTRPHLLQGPPTRTHTHTHQCHRRRRAQSETLNLILSFMHENLLSLLGVRIVSLCFLSAPAGIKFLSLLLLLACMVRHSAQCVMYVCEVSLSSSKCVPHKYRISSCGGGDSQNITADILRH